MIRFTVLGSLDLVGHDGRPVSAILAQPKRTALLAFLGLYNHGGFASRDHLLGVFWPEADEGHARNSLNQSLHHLRVALGRKAFQTRGRGEIRLSPDLVWCDALAFRRARGEGRYERAVELYRGDLLEGLHPAGIPGFEQWREAARLDFRMEFCGAAWSLADHAAVRGDFASATTWARKACARAPYDESALRRLVLLLTDTGNQAAALRACEEFANRLERDLELEPSPETRALVERLRAGDGAADPAPTAPGPAPASRGAVAVTDAERAPVSAPDESAPGPLAALRTRERRRGMAAALLTLTVLTLLYLRLGPVRPPGPTVPEAVAVLPFESLGIEPADRTFADGIHAEVIERLTGIAGLVVRPRTSVMRFRDERGDVRRIAAEADARYLVEASVRRSGGRIRVTASLIDGAADRQIWSESFDRELLVRGVLGIQSEIARRVAASLALELGPQGPAPVFAGMTDDLEAYRLYLSGRDAFYEAGLTNVPELKVPALERAVEAYEQAVNRDPGFARAWAALADPHLSLYWFGHDVTLERRQRARAAAEEALRLRPDSPAAHRAMGRYHYQGERDYEAALRHLRIARAGLPGDDLAWSMIGFVLRRQGKLAESVEAQRQALELAPRTISNITNLASTLRALGRFDESIELYDRALNLVPEAAHIYVEKARVHLGRGDVGAARAVLEVEAATVPSGQLAAALFHLDILDRDFDAALSRLSASTDSFWGPPMQVGPQEALVPVKLREARVHEWLGDTTSAREDYRAAADALETRRSVNPDDPRIRRSLAIAYAGLGRAEDALREAQQALELMPPAADAWAGPIGIFDLAEVLTMVGDHDAAVSVLHSVRGAGWLLPMLELHPCWDPLRRHPAFPELLEESSGET